MTAVNILAAMLIGLLMLVSASAYGEQNQIDVRNEGGRTVAHFKVGDSVCRLMDDQVRCLPVRH